MPFTRRDFLRGSDHIRIAVASCARYAAGYFHAYRHIARRTDLDVVIHLGDYIYEKPGNYVEDGNGKLIRKDVRKVSANEVAVTLVQYRERYACYRRDPDLAELHRQHPMICLWDDHEFANDPAEWDWSKEPSPGVTWDKRVSMARRAHSEWLPMREETTRAYRALSYGDLATIVLTDRQRRYLWPTATATNGNYLDDVQSSWLDSTLSGSRARWTVMGAQTAFGRWTGAGTGGWGTGPVGRVFRAKDLASSPNLVVVSGDRHRFQVSDVPRPSGSGAGAVEVMAGSIASAAGSVEGLTSAEEKARISAGRLVEDRGDFGTNVHYADGLHRGNAVIDLTPARMQADLFGFPNYRKESTSLPAEEWLGGWRSLDGVNKLTKQASAVPAKSSPPAPAP